MRTQRERAGVKPYNQPINVITKFICIFRSYFRKFIFEI